MSCRKDQLNTVMKLNILYVLTVSAQLCSVPDL